jgi:hypothetical protein
MTRCDEIMQFVSHPSYSDGFTLLDLQGNFVGGTAADRRLRELKESGRVENVRRIKVGKGSTVMLMKVAD